MSPACPAYPGHVASSLARCPHGMTGRTGGTYHVPWLMLLLLASRLEALLMALPRLSVALRAASASRTQGMLQHSVASIGQRSSVHPPIVPLPLIGTAIMSPAKAGPVLMPQRLLRLQVCLHHHRILHASHVTCQAAV